MQLLGWVWVRVLVWELGRLEEWAWEQVREKLIDEELQGQRLRGRERVEV